MADGVTYDIRLSVDKLKADLREAETEAKSSATRVAGSTDAITKQGGSTGASSINQIRQGMGMVAKAAGIALATIKGIEVASAGVQLITSAIAGDYNEQVAAANKARNAIAEIPIFGQVILDLGAKINQYTIDLVTHEQEYVAKINAATEAQDKHTDSLARQLEARKKVNQEFADFAKKQVDAGNAATQSEQQKREADIAARRKELAEFLTRPESRDKAGNLTESAKSRRDEAEAAIAKLQLAGGLSVEESQSRQNAEFAAARARANNDEKLAQQVEFDEQLRQAEIEAAKKGADELANVQTINSEKRKAREVQLAIEAEKEKLAAAQDRASKQAAMDAQINEDLNAILNRQAEERAAKQDKLSELQFDTSQTRLRTAGDNVRAEMEQIQHEAEIALREAGNDPELQQAIADRAMAQADAVIAEIADRTQNQRAEIISSSAAGRTAFGGTDPNDLQRQQLETLKKIADNTGKNAAAVAA
jgi:hypothetical protein